MISISKSKIPKYLRNSDFYNNLNDEGDTIDIPTDCYKKDDSVNNFNDFKRLLSVYQYFGCEFSHSFKRYYVLQCDEVFNHFSETYEEFEVRDMLVKFTMLKIKTIRQFIVTYKIMKLYNLVESNDFYEYYIKNKNSIMYGCKEDDEVEKNLAHNIKEMGYLSISYDGIRSFNGHSIGLTLKKGWSVVGGLFTLNNNEINSEIDKLTELRSCIFDMKNTTYSYRFLTYENRVITTKNKKYDVEINPLNRLSICSDITEFISLLENIRKIVSNVL